MTHTRVLASILIGAFWNVLAIGSAQAGLIGTDVTLQVSTNSSVLRSFGPTTSTVGGGDEFNWTFMDGRFQTNIATVNLDDDSVELAFFQSGDSFGTTAPTTFSFTGVTWLGMPLGEIVGLSILEDTLVGSTVTTNITGVDSFEIRLSSFNTGGDGTLQILRVGIEASHPVPEPTSTLLLGLGLGLILRQRKYSPISHGAYVPGL